MKAREMSVEDLAESNRLLRIALNDQIERTSQAEARVKELEAKYRKCLWSSHGHNGIYGDDGEMQCGECSQFGGWDYLRSPLEDVERAYGMAIIARAAAETRCACGHIYPDHIGTVPAGSNATPCIRCACKEYSAAAEKEEEHHG